MTKYVVSSTWEDSPHISSSAAAELEASYLPYERDARTKGIPSLGAGAIYPVAESDLVCDPFVLEDWYEYVYALDVGWRRTAVLWGARDPETDVLYLWSEHYRGDAEPAVHAEAVRSRGLWVPGVVDPAARGRSQKDGERLITIYRDLGLQLTPADNSVTSGIYAVWQRMSSGRLKVFKTCQNFFGEFRVYRRDEKGDIVKENDHLMDCMRYLCGSGLSAAIQKPVAMVAAKRVRHQVDYDPFKQSFEVQK